MERLQEWVEAVRNWRLCEPRYEMSPMLAEAFNTLSNLPGIILSLIGFINSVHMKFERRFCILHFYTMVVGVGSMLLHCTLIVKQHLSDEIPMVWVMLLFIHVLYAPEIRRRRMFPLFLVLYGTGFMVLHLRYQFVIGFQLHYFFLAMVCAPGMLRHYMRTTDCLARRFSHQYLLCFSCFIGIWAVDQKSCNRKTTLPVTPQWHALFHVLNGLNNYFGIMYLQYCRAHQLDLRPELRYIRGVLPYVKVLMKHQAAPVILAQAAAQELEDSKEL